MPYNLYNKKIKQAGASIHHTPRSKHNEEIKKPGDGQPFNEQLIPVTYWSSPSASPSVSPSASPSASPSSIVVPDLIDEQFETVSPSGSPAGCDYEWDYLYEDGGDTLDPDQSTSAISAPSSWGSYCAHISRVLNTDNGATLIESFSPDLAISYIRVELMVTNLCADVNGLGCVIIAGYGVTVYNLFYAGIEYYDSALRFFFAIWDTPPYSSETVYYSDAISEDTFYRLETKWDVTNTAWEWKVDGVSQDNGNINNNTTYLDSVNIGFVGARLTTPYTGDMYMDNVGLDTNEWIGAS